MIKSLMKSSMTKIDSTTDWIYQGNIFTEIIDQSYGFVYKITNTATGRMYIGKKLFYSQKTKTVKGKKKRTKVESDWQKYYGSNDELKKEVEIFGIINFRREILRLCKNKGECTYYEAKYQFEYDVLTKPNQYYNSWIMCKVHRSHLQLNSAE